MKTILNGSVSIGPCVFNGELTIEGVDRAIPYIHGIGGIGFPIVGTIAHGELELDLKTNSPVILVDVEAGKSLEWKAVDIDITPARTSRTIRFDTRRRRFEVSGWAELANTSAGVGVFSVGGELKVDLDKGEMAVKGEFPVKLPELGIDVSLSGNGVVTWKRGLRISGELSASYMYALRIGEGDFIIDIPGKRLKIRTFAGVKVGTLFTLSGQELSIDLDIGRGRCTFAAACSELGIEMNRAEFIVEYRKVTLHSVYGKIAGVRLADITICWKGTRLEGLSATFRSTVKIASFEFANLAFSLSDKGFSGRKTLRVGGSEYHFRVDLSKKGKLSAYGKGCIRVHGYDITNCDYRITGRGIEGEGRLRVPGGGSVVVTFLTRSDGVFSAAGRGTVALLGRKVADADVRLTPAGLAISGRLDARPAGRLDDMKLKISSDGEISGTGRVRIGKRTIKVSFAKRNGCLYASGRKKGKGGFSISVSGAKLAVKASGSVSAVLQNGSVKASSRLSFSMKGKVACVSADKKWKSSQAVELSSGKIRISFPGFGRFRPKAVTKNVMTLLGL